MTTSSRATARAEAQLFETYAREWKAWNRIISVMGARLDEMEDKTSFDDVLDGGTARSTRRQAEDRLNREVEKKLRTALEGIYTDRRSAWLTKEQSDALAASTVPASREVVERGLIDRFRAELNGSATDAQGRSLTDGQSLYYRPTAKDLGDFWKFDHRKLTVVSSQDFLQAGESLFRTQRVLIIVSACLFMLAVGAFFLLGNDDPPAAAASAPIVMVGSNPVALWDSAAMQVGGERWPVAFSLPGLPTAVCVPPEHVAKLVIGQTLTLSGTTSVRQFRLEATDTPDLVLKDCTLSPPITVAAGRVEQAVQFVALDPALLVRVESWAADIAPDVIPPDQMRVVVLWKDEGYTTGRLILPNGATVAATGAVAALADGYAVTYLIPSLPYPQTVGFVLNQPGRLAGRMTLDIPAPIQRAAWLRSLLTCTYDNPRWEERHGQIFLVVDATITTGATSASAPQLLEQDVTVRDGSTLLAVAWIPPLLAVGETVETSFAIPINPAATTLTLTLAGSTSTFSW